MDAASGAVIREEVDRLVAEWCERDRAHAFLPVDAETIESTATVRALIIEQLASGGEMGRDLFHAWATLGRLTAARGGSPSLVAVTVDGARAALSIDDAPWVLPARAAVAEAYAAARREAARAEAAARWEYPTCAAKLHEGIVAIVAGYPEDDEDALSAWAARVANAAALGGVRRVVLGGSAAARAALADALSVTGIEVLRGYEPPAPRRT